MANPARRLNSWSATTPAASICRSSNSNESPEKLNVEMAYAIRTFARSSRLKVCCHYPIVNYCLLFAISALRKPIISIVKPGPIGPQIGRKNYVVRNTWSSFAAHGLGEHERSARPGASLPADSPAMPMRKPASGNGVATFLFIFPYNALQNSLPIIRAERCGW